MGTTVFKTEDDIVKKLLLVRDSLLEVEESTIDFLQDIHPNYRYNVLNFLRYLKFRTFDLTAIQSDLTALGISSLSHAERHVLANIENILYLLSAHINIPFTGKYEFGKHPINYKESGEYLKKNTLRLFGEHLNKQGVMVTLPSEGVTVEFLSELLDAGMNIARINCSHDNLKVWKAMIVSLKESSRNLQKPCTIYMDLAGPKIRTDRIFLKKKLKEVSEARIYVGNIIFLVKKIKNFETKEDFSAVVTCTIPSVIDDAKEGESILFDDGKIEGIIEKKANDTLKIRILNTNPKGSKLKTEKGINLPDTYLNLPSLTLEDVENLDFICSHADIVGFSFVRNPKDVAQLQEELKKRDSEALGIVLKIENREAFQNLPSLILQAMKSPTIGIMTARGDLAVELGIERLSEVQEEIMWLCEAALIPNIWATQVLESLAKKGIASRAEVTDAAMSVRTECIMLNKGPYIVKALKTLNAILSRMEKHQSKKQGNLRSLGVANSFWQN